MKKFLVALLMIGFVASAQTTTPNLGLQIPATGSNNWYIPLNYNFNKLDQLLGGTLALTNLTVTNLTTTNFNIPAGSIVTSLGFDPLNPANNLSDVASASAALANLGGIGVSNVKGTYSNTTSYNQGDIVSSTSGAFISLVGSNLGNTPESSPSFWELFVSGSGFSGGVIPGNSTVVNNAASTSIGAVNTVANNNIGLVAYSNGFESIGSTAANFDYMWFQQVSGFVEAILPATSIFGWSASNSASSGVATADTGFDRVSPGVIAVDGPLGAATGELDMGKLVSSSEVDAVTGNFSGNVAIAGTCTVGGVPCGSSSGGGNFGTVNNTDVGYFTDLDPANAGGIVAAGGDPATQNAVEQATALAAACWQNANGGRATFYKSRYGANVSNLEIGTGITLTGFTDADEQYGYGSPSLVQMTAGTGTEASGNSVVDVDYSYTATCPGGSSPIALGGNDDIIKNLTLSGAGGGGFDEGVRVIGYNNTVMDVNGSGFGGAFIRDQSGFNNRNDWNYATNVCEFYQNEARTGTTPGSCSALSFYTTDGEASHNQISTGWGFSNAWVVNPLSYHQIFAFGIAGSGNYITDNLVQTDETGVFLAGQENRFLGNRIEFMGAELLDNECSSCIVSGTAMLSGGLDHTQMRPAAWSSSTAYTTGQQVSLSNSWYTAIASSTNQTPPNATYWTVYQEPWNSTDTYTSGEYIYYNDTYWVATAAVPANTPPPDSRWTATLSVGVNAYFGILDTSGGGNVYSANFVGQEEGLNGPSYYRGSYFTPGNGALLDLTNHCDQDIPDKYGNNQCHWGGDLYANGGGIGTIANNRTYSEVITNNVVYVGDYSHITLVDTSTNSVNSFVGESDGQNFDLTPVGADQVVNPNVGYYGHPTVVTCDGFPLLMKKGHTYNWTYSAENAYQVQQTACPSVSNSQALFNYTNNLSIAPTTDNVGTVSVFGTTQTLAEPTHNIDQIQNNGGDTSFTYCYIIAYYNAGAYHTTATACLDKLPLATPSGFQNFFAINAFPPTMTSWTAYRYSSTNPAISSVGVLGTGTNNRPEGYDTGAALTGTVPPANINTSGRISVGNSSDTSAVTHSSLCNNSSQQNDVWVQNGHLNVCIAGVPYIVTTTAAP
jgi:hypothetical protein